MWGIAACLCNGTKPEDDTVFHHTDQQHADKQEAKHQETHLGGVHDDCGDEVEEDVVAVGANNSVAEGHLQLIHRLQEQPLALILQVLEGSLLQCTGWLRGGRSTPCTPNSPHLCPHPGAQRGLALVMKSEWRTMARMKKR